MTKRKTRILPRDPLSDEELEKLTAHDVAHLSLTDNEIARLREINQLRERERAERWERIQKEQKILLEELRAAGLDIDYVARLINTNQPYPEAIPILLRHLQLPYSDVTIETIARALAVKDARSAWPILADRYRNAPKGIGPVAPEETEERKLLAKDGLAVALSATVTDETLNELIALAKDRSQGSSRVLLLSALKKRRKDPVVKQAIDELATDPDLEKEIASWRRR